MKTTYALDWSLCGGLKASFRGRAAAPRRRFWTGFAKYVVVSLTILSLMREGSAYAAASVEGAILGQVRDLDSGQPVSGATVVASGPEGDVATFTDAKGNYQLRALPIGHYTVRFHRDEVLAERDATVGVDKIVRVNIRLPAVPSETQTVAAPYVAPLIDVGSSRIGTTFRSDFIDNVPNRGDDVLSLIAKTPGGYNEQLGPAGAVNNPVGLSLSGGTGADNSYYLDGLNVTSIRDGLLGTNLKSAFLEEVEVMSSGFGVEYGRALGGVVNMALKSGTNEWKGSAFSWVEPGWMAGSQHRIQSRATVLTGNTQPDYTTQLGAEVGGPIIKNKLFVWFGYVPEISRSHFVQYTDSFVDRDRNGQFDTNPDGSPVVDPLFTRLIPQESTTHNYAGHVTWRVAPDQMLSLSLVGIQKDEEFMRGANMDVMAGMSHEITSRQDVIARWQSAFFERHWRIDASVGLHNEGYSRHSPYGDMESMNDITWKNNPSLGQFDPIAAPYCRADPTTGFDPCPVQGYQSGGYGAMREMTARRWAGQIKSTHVFRGFGLHELKYGVDYELNQFDDKVWNSGINGSRGSTTVYPDSPYTYSFYRLPYSDSIFNHDATELGPNGLYYQDSIHAKTTALNQAAFIQESYLPLPNLTINLGLRWEAQRLTDYQGNTALSITDSLAPRVGVVYDPTKEGRSKIYAHFGRYYESIPMDLADKAFGGQGAVVTSYSAGCATPGSLSSCGAPDQAFAVTGDRLYVMPHIKGAYNNEVVLGAQYQLLQDLVIGGAVIYRWLGRAIEDTGGSLESGQGPSILANPGTADSAAVADLKNRAAGLQAAAALPDATPATKAAAAQAQALADAAQMPNPERTYKAIQLTASKRLAKNWFFAGSYTYSRTMGNYTGLYAADYGQLNPNTSMQFDVRELMVNQHGPMPNDRPHVIHVDGFYQYVRGRHMLTPGLGFVGMSGQPLTPLGASADGADTVFILPRGSAGRTPFFTQLDFHLSYRTKMSNGLAAETFVDVFNILNQKTVLTEDQEYTTDSVNFDSSGKPIPPAAQGNPNYLRATSYQTPISGRMGVRVFF